MTRQWKVQKKAINPEKKSYKGAGYIFKKKNQKAGGHNNLR